MNRMLFLVVAAVAVVRAVPYTQETGGSPTEYVIPKNLSPILSDGGSLAISSDGMLAFGTTGGGIYIKSRNDFEARRIPGSEGEVARQLFFWPAGDWLGYWDEGNGQLKRIRTSGGKPEFLANSGNPFSPFLTTDDRIIFRNGQNLVWIPVKGGQPQVFFRPGAPIFGSQLLADGRTIVYTTGAFPPIENLKIAVRSIDKDDETILFRAHPVTYLRAGYLVYGSGNDLAARRFNPETRSLAGEVTLVRDLLVSGGRMQYQLSPGGEHLAYFRNTSGRETPNHIVVHLGFGELVKQRVPK